MPGWDSAGFDAAKWAPVVATEDSPKLLVAQVGETIRVTQDLPAQQVTEVEKGLFVVDFGQNAAARIRLKSANKSRLLPA